MPDGTLAIAMLSALLAGIAGSGHCLAMCGGMAGLLSARTVGSGRPARRTVSYNLGRVSSYALGGLLAGGLGYSVGIATGLDAAAGQLRVISGAIIVLAGLYLLTGMQILALFDRLGERAWRRISPLAAHQLRNGASGSGFVLGMLWGWLPCGMTWSMLAVAAASGNPLTGAAVMLAFGAGTLPAMLAVGLAGFRLRGLLNRVAMRRAAAVVLIVAGTWTIVFPLTIAHGEPTPNHVTHHH